MSRNYTKYHVDFAALPWLTSPRHQLGLQGVAIGLINLPPNEGYTFTHRHRRQEEVYMVIRGRGRILLGTEEEQLVEGDLVRVAPETRRALKAEADGLLVICAGGIPLGYPQDPDARYLIDDGIPDYEDIPPWYRDDPAVIEKNRRLGQRQEKARQRRSAARVQDLQPQGESGESEQNGHEQ